MKKELFFIGGLATICSVLFIPEDAFSCSKWSCDARLKGTYVRSVSRSCIQTTAGGIQINKKGELVVKGDAYSEYPQSRHSALGGNITFYGDGTGSMDVDVGRIRLKSHQVFEPSASGPVVKRSLKIGERPLDKRESECTFDYELSRDNSFLMDNFECYSQSVPFGRVGTPSLVTGMVIHGQMAKGRQTLSLTDTDTNIETIQVVDSQGNAMDEKYERVCIRSGMAVKSHR